MHKHLTLFNEFYIIEQSLGGIVQLVEHRTHIPYVIGSSPIAPTYFTLMIFHEGIFFIVRYISFGLEPTVLRAEIVDFVETRLESRLTTFFACGDRLATYCPYLFCPHDFS